MKARNGAALICLGLASVLAIVSGLATRALASNTEQVRQDGTCGDAGDRPRIFLHVDGMRSVKGNLRVNVYGDNPEEFLAKGKKMLRIDTPVTALAMDICLWLPETGTYALVVMHDTNANGKYNWTLDGAATSNNPKPRMFKPKYAEAAFSLGTDGMKMAVTMLYRTRRAGR